MTSLRTLLLACLVKIKFSYLDLSVAANRKALFYHVGDMRIGTIPSADITEQLIFSFSLFNSLLQWTKRIGLPNSSVIDNFCINIIVSIFVCFWAVTERWQPSCLARRFIVCADTCARILTCQLEISSEKTPCEANRQKISLAELASNWKENKQVRNKWLRPQGGGNGGRYKS